MEPAVQRSGLQHTRRQHPGQNRGRAVHNREYRVPHGGRAAGSCLRSVLHGGSKPQRKRPAYGDGAVSGEKDSGASRNGDCAGKYRGRRKGCDQQEVNPEILPGLIREKSDMKQGGSQAENPMRGWQKNYNAFFI